MVFPYAVMLGCVVCLAPQLFLPVYLQVNVGLPSLPATALLCVLSAFPTSLNECFFFTSLVVRLPYGLIFWNLLLFLNWLWSFFWLCEEVKHICLCLHLGQKSRKALLSLWHWCAAKTVNIIITT